MLIFMSVKVAVPSRLWKSWIWLSDSSGELQSGGISKTQHLKEQKCCCWEVNVQYREIIVKIVKLEKSAMMKYFAVVDPLPRMSNIEEDMDKIVSIVHEIRNACDRDGDGKISREEFVSNAKKSVFLYEMLSDA